MTSDRKKVIKRKSKPLTPREKLIWKQVVLGRTSREIARKLHLHPRTVEDCRDILRVKLNAARTADLIARWYQKSKK